MDEWKEVLKFWFEETDEKKWFAKDENFDEDIRKRFGELHKLASHGALENWMREAESALALVIVLDQFSRNMFRDKSQAFAQDSLARDYSEQAIEKGFDLKLDGKRRAFFYMPFMHSENIEDQDKSVEFFEHLAKHDPKEKGYLAYAKKHRDIIEKFDRFPHRNRILKRESTPEEEEFLTKEGSSF